MIFPPLKIAFDEAKPELVFHLAAQPIVLESYRDSVGTYSINVMGTVNVLECIRQSNSVKSFVNITTDMGTSSFYPPHHITMGQGGAVYTNNPLLNKIMHSFRDWGRDCVFFCQDNFCGYRFDGQYGELYKGYDHKYVYLANTDRIMNDTFWVGVYPGMIDEKLVYMAKVIYGSAKLVARILTRQRAMDLGIEWIWGRIFSLYGKYEPTGRMLLDLVASLHAGKYFYMQSDGHQNLDYLNFIDGAEALIALGEKGKSGEIYNIVGGKYKPLKVCIEYLQKAINSEAKIHYAMDKKTLFSLQVDVNKIQKNTEWNGNVELYV